jgi:integrase
MITFANLIGLIACTGLRMGEALRLKETDFDPEAGTLHVPRAKFSPERVLPLQPTVRALQRYQTARRRHPLCTDRFFVGRTGHPLNQQTVYYTFRGLTRDFVTNGARRRPRFHDFRHTLATKLIAKWSQEQAPVAHHLLLLCRYLGHRSFRDTFWYVSADPAALASVAERFKRFWHARTESAHEPNLVPLAHSEITQLQVADADGQVVHLHGKGRKLRSVPIWPQTRRLIQQWRRTHQLQPGQPLFTNRTGQALTRVGVSLRLARAVRLAARTCPTHAKRRISPHTFRHATTFHLLRAGVAFEVIFLWLGHSSPVTTYNYVEADLKMKAECIAKLKGPPPPRRPCRAQYPRILAFLEAL